MEKTSIIILAYQEPKKFIRMFETLLRNTDKEKTPYEIIVVDNDSNKEIKEYLVSQKDKIDYIIVNPENLGVTKGYNQGVSKSTGYYLCFYNSDYYMMKDWLESMITCFNHTEKIGLISCCTNITINDDERVFCEFTDKTNVIVNLPEDYKETIYPIAQMFTTRKIYDEVNGFDEFYFVSVLDYDFAESIRRKGYRTFVNRKCFGYHHFNVAKIRTLEEIDKKNMEYFNKKWKK